MTARVFTERDSKVGYNVLMESGQSLVIPPLMPHRLEAYDGNAMVLEFGTERGAYRAEAGSAINPTPDTRVIEAGSQVEEVVVPEPEAVAETEEAVVPPKRVSVKSEAAKTKPKRRRRRKKAAEDN